MPGLKLSKIQSDLIPLVQLNARQSPAKLAKQLGVRERSVTYQLAGLNERGIIRAAPFINVYPLGYRYVNLYFSVSSSRSTEIEQLVQLLLKTPQVAWLAELGADFHYGLSMMVREVEEVKESLDYLSRKFPAFFFEKSYVFHISLTVFPAKFLTARQIDFPELGYGARGKQVAADELDLKILSVMAQSGLISGRAIARELGRSHATVELRLRQLEKQEVIAGYWNLIDLSQLGYQTLKLLIYGKGHHFEFSRKLYEFARRHPHISYFIECLGAWDFELGLDVEDASQVAAVSREILDAFGPMINTIKAVPMFRVLKWRQFTRQQGLPPGTPHR